MNLQEKERRATNVFILLLGTLMFFIGAVAAICGLMFKYWIE